ncbi:MAG: hypothetical protein R3E73_08875 [Porticoccaceae bacterium]
MFANRLKKNSRKLKPWLKQSGVSCYRLYDADMPEYAVAVDIYHDAIHVQEYAPPQQIGEQQANKHLSEVKQALQYLYPQSRAKLFLRSADVKKVRINTSEYPPAVTAMLCSVSKRVVQNWKLICRTIWIQGCFWTIALSGTCWRSWPEANGIEPVLLYRCGKLYKWRWRVLNLH